MSWPTWTPDTVAAQKAARAALDVIARREGDGRVETKSGLDIVTGTDMLAQQVIREILERERPVHHFVGEESGADRVPTEGSFWLVDPICGTRNYASRLPLICVNIALVEGGKITTAVAADGASGNIYVAERGRGAWVDRGTGLEALRTNPESPVLFLEPGAPGKPDAAHAAAIVSAAITSGQWEVRILSTSLDSAFVASGSAAAAWYAEVSSPLHYAAGVLIAEEAGATVSDERGRPWRLDSGNLLVSADAAVHARVLALIAAVTA